MLHHAIKVHFYLSILLRSPPIVRVAGWEGGYRRSGPPRPGLCRPSLQGSPSAHTGVPRRNFEKKKNRSENSRYEQSNSSFSETEASQALDKRRIKPVLYGQDGGEDSEEIDLTATGTPEREQH